MNETTSLFSLHWFEVIFAGISVFAIYSFLYKENKFYRFFEHLFIGIATGITVMVSISNFLYPQVIKPMLGLDRMAFPDGTYPTSYDSNYLLYLIPISFGLLYYTILTKRYNWIAQLVIGFMLGIGGGLAFKGTLNELIPQLTNSFRPLYNPNLELKENLSNIVFIFVIITVMSYFFFTFKRNPKGIVQKCAISGRWMMMGCFGAFFGATIMARMALLVERIQFLINDWGVAVLKLIK